MLYCRGASPGYLACPTHTDESQLLSGSVCSACTSPVWHRSKSEEGSANSAMELIACVCVCVCRMPFIMYSVRSYISPPFFNFSPFFIVCLSLPLCCIHKQLGWIKHFNDPRLISAFALNSPSSRGKAKVWFEICTSDCGRIITPEIFFQKFKLCTSSPPCTLEYVSFKAAWFIIFQNSALIIFITH